MVNRMRQAMDPNREVHVRIAQGKNGNYAWIATDAETGKHVAVGSWRFLTAKAALEDARAFLKVSGE